MSALPNEGTSAIESTPTAGSAVPELLYRLRQALEAEHAAENALAQARQNVRELLTRAREAGIRYNTIARSLVPPGDPFESMRARRAMVGRLRQRFWTARKKRQRA
jgi:hypothetical protein